MQTNTDRGDSRTFAILFRRENAYLKAVKAAKSTDSPEARLTEIIPVVLNLDSNQAFNLERFAGGWEAEVAPVRLEMMAAIASFHNTFPNGRLNSHVDPTVPAQIRVLRTQIDAVTLRYRDQLRNAMPESDFQAFLIELRQTFGPEIANQ